MKNILSYLPSTRYKGKEIKEWIIFNIENQTEHTKEAKRMVNYLNILDDAEYLIHKGDYQASKRRFVVYKCK